MNETPGPQLHRSIHNLRITFWGVQGSCPVPHRGGDTTCIEVETSEGNIILFDAGTGIRRCSLGIVNRWANRPAADRTVHIFGSHEHLDHRQGLTFSRFCYVDPPFNLHIYGGYQFLHALDHHYGVFSHQITDSTYVDDPVDYTIMSAKFVGTEIIPQHAVLSTSSAHPHRRATDVPRRYWDTHPIADPIRIGRTTIQPFEVYHVIPCCLGYKLEHDGRTFIFATDHELRRGPAGKNEDRQQRSQRAESALRELSQNVDLAYVDGQYFLDEYAGKKGIGLFPSMPRLDWGHSCIEDVIERSIACNIKRTLIGHHDPERDLAERQRIDAHLKSISTAKPNHLQLADSDLVIDL